MSCKSGRNVGNPNRQESIAESVIIPKIVNENQNSQAIEVQPYSMSARERLKGFIKRGGAVTAVTVVSGGGGNDRVVVTQ